MTDFAEQISRKIGRFDAPKVLLHSQYCTAKEKKKKKNTGTEISIRSKCKTWITPLLTSVHHHMAVDFTGKPNLWMENIWRTHAVVVVSVPDRQKNSSQNDTGTASIWQF